MRPTRRRRPGLSRARRPLCWLRSTAKCPDQPTALPPARLRARREDPALAPLARHRVWPSGHGRVGPTPPAALPHLLRQGSVKSRENFIAKSRKRTTEESAPRCAVGELRVAGERVGPSTRGSGGAASAGRYRTRRCLALSPSRSRLCSGRPKQMIHRMDSRPGRRALVDGELLTQGKVLEGELAVAADEEWQEPSRWSTRLITGRDCGRRGADRSITWRRTFWRRAARQ